MPYPHSQNTIHVLDEGKVSSLNDVLLKLLAVVEGYFFC